MTAPTSAVQGHLLARVSDAPAVALPSDKRVPYGWGWFALAPAGEGPDVKLHWPSDAAAPAGAARLRLGVALDDREIKRIEAYLLDSGTLLGTFDMRYAQVLQPFEIELTPDQAAAALRDGVGLRMVEGTQPLFLFYDEPPRGEGHEVYLPHLLIADDQAERVQAFYQRMTSRATLQQFGWMEGCVLDGLWEMTRHAEPRWRQRAHEAFELHLQHYFVGDRLVYESPRGEVADELAQGVERMMMFGHLANWRPAHPSLDRAIAWWVNRVDDAGEPDEPGITCEGCYTMAYPQAVAARIGQRRDLAELAVKNLRHRRQRLATEDNIYLRHRRDDDVHTYPSWARGVAWYMLGHVRALIELHAGGWDDIGPIDDVRNELGRAADWVISLQRDDGMWHCFMHEPETLPEASGSAGVAAALALGAEHGLLPASAADAAARTADTLPDYLTPDGLLHGVTQGNKREGGEALQRSGYRVIKPNAMGLMAQLLACLSRCTA